MKNDKRFEATYKRLNYEEYIGVIKDTLVPLFDDYDGEFITMVSEDTKFTIKEHWAEKIKMGYNIMADGVLIETRSTMGKARNYLRRLVEKINT